MNQSDLKEYARKCESNLSEEERSKHKEQVEECVDIISGHFVNMMVAAEAAELPAKAFVGLLLMESVRIAHAAGITEDVATLVVETKYRT